MRKDFNVHIYIFVVVILYCDLPSICGLHSDVVVYFVLDTSLGQRVQNRLHRREAGQVLIRHQTNIPGPEVLKVL